MLIGILFSFLFFIGFAFVLTRIQEDLIFNFAIKPHFAAIFNSLFYTLSFFIYSVSLVGAGEGNDDINMFLTLQELSIFKFTLLVALNVLLYAFVTIEFVMLPKFKLLITMAFLFVVSMQLIAVLLNATKLWTKPWMRVPTGAFFILIYLCFVGLNVCL